MDDPHPTPPTPDERRAQLAHMHAHVRLIGDTLADDLDVSDARREELQAVGRKLAHLPD